MTSRREFLERAAVLSALPAIAGTAFSVAASSPAAAQAARANFHLVLFDERFLPARSAAASISRVGAPVHGLADGDITQVWLNNIGPAWQRSPAAIAGLTARPALFCLEQFAVSSGLRVVFHAEHVVHADGRTEHSLLRGAENLGLKSEDLDRAGSRWHARIAEALAAYQPQPTRPRFARSDAALDPMLPPNAQLLTSWIIAVA